MPDFRETKEAVDWKKVLRKQAEMVYCSDGELVKSDKRLDFDPMPSKHMQEKIDFFYLPYNYKISCSKHLKYNKNED